MSYLEKIGRMLLHKPLLVMMFFSGALACFIESRVFVNPLALNDDVRNQVYWMARILNPGLFSNDYIADYFTQPLLVSPFVKSLYQSWAFVLGPLRITQLLPFILVLLATCFLYKFCVSYKDEAYAFWVTYCFNVSIWLIKNLSGGLPRAFVYPLLFLLFLSIQTKRWKSVAITLWVSALTYFPAFLLGLATFSVLTFRNRQSPDYKQRLHCLGWTLAGLMPIALWRLGFQGDVSQFGPLITAETAARIREFYFGGRVILFSLPYQAHPLPFPGKLIWQALERLPHLYVVIPILVFGALYLLYKKYLSSVLKGFSIPEPVNSSIIASIFLYILAWLCLFYLYVPERYLEYTLFMMPAFIIGGFIDMVIKQYPRAKVPIASGFIIISLFIAHFFWRNDLMDIPPREQALYKAIQNLPMTAMIAASPGLASNIPLYASRSVFLSNEAYIPFHRLYFQEMKSRLRDWLLAYYSSESRPVAALIRKYHIQYIVIQLSDFKERHLKRLPQKTYFGFDDAFYRSLKRNKPNEYYLLNLPDTCLIYKTQDFRVIDTTKCWPSMGKEN